MKKLYRSNTDKVIAGVCGGLAEYFEVDVTVIRIVWAISIFTSIGLISYLIALIIMPLPNDSTQNYYHNNPNPQNFNQNYGQNYNQNYEYNHNTNPSTNQNGYYEAESKFKEDNK